MLVGDDAPSHLYVRLKKERAEKVGIRVEVHALPAETTDQELIALIRVWNADADVNAILVQLPLPKGHEDQRVIDAISPEKDVDGFHPANVAALLHNQPVVAASPLHKGILRLIAETPVTLAHRSVVIIAKGKIFSEPLAHLLSQQGAIVRVMHPDDLDDDALKSADIVVIAIGRKRFLRAAQVKDDAVLIDVGTNKEPDGTVIGDVDRASFADTHVFLTPVPGGVGPMTIALLLRNVLLLAMRQSHK